MRDHVTNCCCRNTKTKAGLTPFDRDEGLVEGELYLQLLMDLDRNISESSWPEEEAVDESNFDLMEHGFHILVEARDAGSGPIRERTEGSLENLFAAAKAPQLFSPASPSRGSPSAFFRPAHRRQPQPTFSIFENKTHFPDLDGLRINWRNDFR